jgi:GntR family transcriptional regulator
MIAFYLEADSGVPAYLQLVRQVEHAIRLGRLRGGDQLPSVRDVVSALGINPNTVVKAYREMESRRLVDTRQGRGTFVADLVAAGARTAPAVIPAAVARELRDWIAGARASGLARDDLAALFDEELRSAFAGAGAA